jgi:hypothetical protein
MLQAAAYEERIGGEPDTLFQTLSKYLGRGWTPIWGLRVAIEKCQGLWRRKPQIAVQVGARAKCTMRKGLKKTLRPSSWLQQIKWLAMRMQRNPLICKENENHTFRFPSVKSPGTDFLRFHHC